MLLVWDLTYCYARESRYKGIHKYKDLCNESYGMLYNADERWAKTVVEQDKANGYIRA